MKLQLLFEVLLIMASVSTGISQTCEESLPDYCSDPELADCTTSIDAVCLATGDPLLCYMNNTRTCGWGSTDCFQGLSYGCFIGECWSQCVGPRKGVWEYCNIGARQSPPTTTPLPCTTNSDCRPSSFISIMCFNAC